MEDDDRLPIEQVLPGHRLHPMDEGWTPLASFNLIKCLDDDGDVVWSFRTSEEFNLEQLLGALVVQTETLRRKLVRQWEGDDPDCEQAPVFVARDELPRRGSSRRQPRLVRQWGPDDERAFLEATIPLAKAVVAAQEPWDVYEAGMHLDGLASNAMSSGPLEGEHLPALPATVFLIWARLTDEMDAPWSGDTPEHHAQAVSRMKQAASEWLACLNSSDARSEYLARWEAAAGDPPPLAEPGRG